MVYLSYQTNLNAMKNKNRKMDKNKTKKCRNEADSNLGILSAIASYAIIYFTSVAIWKNIQDLITSLFGTGFMSFTISLIAIITIIAAWFYLMKYIYETLLPSTISKCAYHQKIKKHKPHESESIETNNIDSHSSEEKTQKPKKE